MSVRAATYLSSNEKIIATSNGNCCDSFLVKSFS